MTEQQTKASIKQAFQVIANKLMPDRLNVIEWGSATVTARDWEAFAEMMHTISTVAHRAALDAESAARAVRSSVSPLEPYPDE